MKIKMPRFLKNIVAPLVRIYDFSREKIAKSLRLQLILVFAICLLGTIFVTVVSAEFLGRVYSRAFINYSIGKEQIDAEARNIISEIKTKDSNLIPDQDIPWLINNNRFLDNKILFVDNSGKVLYKSENATETQVDLQSIINKIADNRLSSPDDNSEFYSFYPVNIKDKQAYLIVRAIPQGNVVYSYQKSPLGFLIGLAFFIFMFYFLTRKKIFYIEELALGLGEISKGNLSHRVAIKSRDELGFLARSINNMSKELDTRITEERKAEQTKNELITNVSHDLRTPLTSVLGYLALIKDQKYENQEQLREFTSIAYGKADKLKGLIEDLFTFTSLSDRGIRVNLEKVSLIGLLEQLIEEMNPVFNENNLQVIKEFPREKVMVEIDVNLTLRVFENLLTNAVKYSYKPGKVKIKLDSNIDGVLVCVQNKGNHIASEDVNRLFERFYRLDKSRSADSGGSGLGLAIAKNIMELQDGQIWADCDGQIINFYVQFRRSGDTKISHGEAD